MEILVMPGAFFINPEVQGGAAKRVGRGKAITENQSSNLRVALHVWVS